MKGDILVEAIMRWFTAWAALKPKIHFSEESIYFKERQIWWASIGQNIGSEQNGKHGNFERPVVILKKFNGQMFLGVPVSTKIKEGPYRLSFTNDKGRFSANLSQMRVMSSKRLLRLVGSMPTLEYERMLQAYRRML